jgi:hypothetical protein
MDWLEDLRFESQVGRLSLGIVDEHLAGNIVIKTGLQTAQSTTFKKS